MKVYFNSRIVRNSSFVLMGVLGFACDRAESRRASEGSPQAPVTPITPVPEVHEAKPAAPAPLADPMAKQDSDMKDVMTQLASFNGKPIESLSATEARQQPLPDKAVRALLKKEDKSTAPEPVAKVAERTIPGPGGALPARVYTPKTGKAPYPVVLYFHGGGFVIATNDTYDASARALANGAEAVVISPEYRKAPENKFPAAHDDAIASYEWLLKNAAAVQGDAKRIAVVGESAGGNLAINVSIAARDKKLPLPVAEVLVYPVAGSDMNTESYVEYAQAKPLNKAMMKWFTDNYFRSPEDAKDKRIDLVNANLVGLPPTTIINAEIDPLRSDGELLAERLKKAEVDVKQKTYAGVTHEFFGMGAAVGEAKDAMKFAVSRLKDSFD